MLPGARMLFERRGTPSYSGLNAFELTVPDDGFDFHFTEGAFAYHDETIRTAIFLVPGHATFTVDWGDGSPKETHDSVTKEGLHHSYLPGTYVMTISDDVQTIGISSCDALTRILNIAPLNTCAPFFWWMVSSGYRFLFDDNRNMQTVDMHESGMVTATDLLKNANSMTDLILPQHLTTIGAFIYGAQDYARAPKLSGGIVLPAALVEVNGPNAFRSLRSVQSIEFPAGVSSMAGPYIFYGETYDVIVHAPTPPTIGAANTLFNFQGRFFVPRDSVDEYKAAQYWSGMADKIFAIEDRT